MIHIKVLQDNFNKKIEEQESETKKSIYPLKIICDNCDSELEISEEDTHIGWLGAVFATCPCCGKETMLDKLEGITLTVDNIKFPVHFLHTKVGQKCCIDESNEDIVREIKKAIEYFRANKDSECWETTQGGLTMFINRYEGDGEYAIYVTKDYYKTYIPFEEIDY